MHQPTPRLRRAIGPAVFFLLAAVALVGIIAATTTDTETSFRPHSSATADATGDAPIPAVGNAPYVPAPGDFALATTVLEEQCFGSAGCNVTFRVTVEYLAAELPDASRTFTAIYTVTGGDEPLTNRFTITGSALSVPAEHHISTSGPGSVLTATVTGTL